MRIHEKVQEVLLKLVLANQIFYILYITSFLTGVWRGIRINSEYFLKLE